MLIVIGGLPGAGKSTLAQAVGARLVAPVIGKDVVEAVLRRSGITKEQGSWRIADDLLVSLGDDLLRQGCTVIVDSVCGRAEFRARLRATAAGAGAVVHFVECVCGDLAVHRSRIEGRRRGIEGWPELEWSDVEGTRRRYETWTENHLTIDTLEPLEASLDAVLRHLAPAD